MEAWESPDSDLRYAALRDLEKRAGPEHVPALKRLLKDPESGIRVKACKILAGLGGEAATEIEPLLADSWHGCRAAAAEALAKLDRAKYLPRIADLILDPHMEVKATAMTCIAESEAEELAERLLPLLQVPDHYLHIRSAEILCFLSGSRFLTEILPLLRAREEGVTLRALRLIAEFGMDRHADALLPLLADRNPDISGEAILALTRRDPETYGQRLQGWIQEYQILPKDPRGRIPLVGAMRLLASLALPGAAPSLERFLRREEENIAGWAALLIARLDAREFLGEIRSLAESDLPEASLAAEIALIRLGELDRRAQGDALASVKGWREEQQHFCVHSSADLELDTELLDALQKVHGTSGEAADFTDWETARAWWAGKLDA